MEISILNYALNISKPLMKLIDIEIINVCLFFYFLYKTSR